MLLILFLLDLIQSFLLFSLSFIFIFDHFSDFPGFYLSIFQPFILILFLILIFFLIHTLFINMFDYTLHLISIHQQISNFLLPNQNTILIFQQFNNNSNFIISLILILIFIFVYIFISILIFSNLKILLIILF